MAAGEMEVSAVDLNAGGESCRDAAASAQRAAQELGRETVRTRIFGDFDEAHALHAAVKSGYQHHQDRLQGHRAWV
jgi:hypothetical protein